MTVGVLPSTYQREETGLLLTDPNSITIYIFEMYSLVEKTAYMHFILKYFIVNFNLKKQTGKGPQILYNGSIY